MLPKIYFIRYIEKSSLYAKYRLSRYFLLLYLYPLNQRLYDFFNPLALRALPLLLRDTEGEG